MNGILISTWSDGVYELADSTSHAFAGRSVAGLSRSPSGRVLGIVDGHMLVERVTTGEWRDVARSQQSLSCLLCTAGSVFVGTDDAAILKLSSHGELLPLDGFATVAGREDWYAGTAIVAGEEVGPPLGVRSMTVTSDESALLANVHVGGIARSEDQGTSWNPTIEIDYDIHEVSAHPARPSDVIAAAAIGLCISTDAGRNWTIETAGLHASYCSATRYCENTIFVAASEHHFSQRGALYQRTAGGDAALERVSGGLPSWFDGIIDTACIGTLGARIAIADRGGHLYESVNRGWSWSPRAEGLESPSAVLLF